MGSYIQIDSISIDLTDPTDKTDAGKCEHFSIRGYVSEIRQKDWKICWPFPVHESEEKPSLLPLDVPKFRWWCCQNCRQEIAAEGIDKDDRADFDCYSSGCRSDSNCSNAALRSGIPRATMPNTLERRDIDLNKPTNLSCGSDCFPISNEIETEAGVLLSRITDHEILLEDNLNSQVTGVPSSEVYLGCIQEVRTNERGCDDNEISDVELATSYPKCIEKSSAEIYNEGTPISADGQCQKELRKSCTISGEGTIVTEADNITDNTTGHLHDESVACNHSLPAGSTDNVVETDFFKDHHLEKSTTGLPRKRPRKMRLLADLLSENGEPKTEEISLKGSASHDPSNASAALQTLSIFPGKVDVQGDLTLTNRDQSKTRKFLLDEEWRPADMCFQRVENEVQNLEVDAKTIDTILDIGSEDILLGIGSQDTIKGYQSKPETKRRYTMGQNKMIQVVDNHLISEPHQGQQTDNEDTTDVANKAYASKTLSSRFFPNAFKEKGMDGFSFHALKTENKCNFSKGKGKILQDDRELDSLSCWKNDIPVEDSFAHTEVKIMSNMPISVPIPSAQGALNGEGLEEGLHLSLNSDLSAQVHSRKCIHHTENQLPLSLPFQEGTSKVHQLKRKDMTNAISGTRVHLEEITGARNTEKTAEAMEQVGIRFCDQMPEKVSEQGTEDAFPMEIVELMAKNQYERSLPDVETRSSLPEKSTVRRKAQMIGGTAFYGQEGELSLFKEGWKEKPHGRHGKNGMLTRGENVKPNNRNSDHYNSTFVGNHLVLNNLCSPQSPFRFEVSQSQKKPSSGLHFSPLGSSQLGSAQNFQFNGNIAECGSSDATLQSQGGCSLHRSILQQDEEASRIWASWTRNHVSLGYDVPKKVVSQPTSSNIGMISLQSGALQKQNLKRDIDLNYINLNDTDHEKLNRNTGLGTFSSTNAEYPFTSKHDGMEPHQNLRVSPDLYSNEQTIPAMHLIHMQSGTPLNMGDSAQMLKTPPYPGDCNTKLEIGTSKTHASLKRKSSDYYNQSYLSDKSHDYSLGSPVLGESSSIQKDEKFISPTDFNGQNLTNGKRKRIKSSNPAMQNGGTKHYSCPCLKTETPVQHKFRCAHETSVPLKSISENSCMVNKNPADFTMPETGNAYMIKGEDLKFETSVPKSRPGLPTPNRYKKQRNLKGAKMLEHEKH